MKKIQCLVFAFAVCLFPFFGVSSVSADEQKAQEDVLVDIPTKKIDKLPRIQNMGDIKPIRKVNTTSIEEFKKKEGLEVKPDRNQDVQQAIDPPIGIQATWERITNTKQAPYNGVVSLYVFYDDYIVGCAGSMIDPTSVLTAAHCIYDTYSNTLAEAVLVVPGENPSDGSPYGSAMGTEVAFTTNWKDVKPPNPDQVRYTDIRFDYAVVNVDPEDRFPVFTFTMRSSVSDSEKVTASGYPNEYQYKSVGNITDYDRLFEVINNNTRTEPGMSGGPLWNTTGVGTTQIGINSAKGDNKSMACPLDETTKKLIQSWQ
ncbi:hypothetical protein GCM10007416_35250 [Kroppenstedtia guangzhouensis]|uniref:Serine protease n=1 Tax=Kroppenstedtia guangzhouensis TaxID=1274356 RepID=A0ABQ1H513_9BACL|nr:trypsin-like peptidase domain-containing protein [Kroppenstedtia guangzhouensis]GGA59074.1 hypothetical protein GCM10007416_35250 [Kroppenstedtia guangzhouensis]